MKKKIRSISALIAAVLMLLAIFGAMTMTVLAYEDEEEYFCPHVRATYIEIEEIAPTCFEPGLSNYWFCEDCSQYLTKDKSQGYWEEPLASKVPALGHAFNTDTGKCDNCGNTVSAQG